MPLTKVWETHTSTCNSFYYGDNNKMYIVILDEADSGKEFAGITQYNLVVEQKLWEIVHQTLYV